jgi:hypothetical protein
MHKETYFSTQRARFRFFETWVYFANFISRGGSYFGSDEDPSRTFVGSIFAYIHVIFIRLSGLSFIIS